MGMGGGEEASHLGSHPLGTWRGRGGGLSPGFIPAQAFHAFTSPHCMVEIRGAEKGLLCKGCDLGFSDADGPTGSGEGTEVEAEALGFTASHKGRACLGLFVEDLSMRNQPSS